MNDNVRIISGGNVDFPTIEASLNCIETSMSHIMMETINDIDTKDNSLDVSSHMKVFTSIIGATGSLITTIAARINDAYGDDVTWDEMRKYVDEFYDDTDSTAFAARLAAAKQFLIDTGEYKKGQLESNTDLLDLFTKHTTTIMEVEASDSKYKNELVDNYFSTRAAGYSYEDYSSGYSLLYTNLATITSISYSCNLNNSFKTSTVSIVIGNN